MRKLMNTFASPRAALLCGSLLAGLALCAPAMAQDKSQDAGSAVPGPEQTSHGAAANTTPGPRLQAAPSASMSSTAPVAGAPTAQTPRGQQIANQVETRIKDLHTRLHITQAEEPQFDKFADTMRQNAEHMDNLFAQRREAKNPSAVDDMNFYAQLTQTHAQDTQVLAQSFAALYNELSPQQKKMADQDFQGARQTGNSRMAPGHAG